MNKKVNIIGAGIAGLCAGAYLQKNGYDTEVFEMHSIPGGLCTAWERNGYTFDGCVHWLVGSSPESDFYKLWNELIDMKTIQFVDQSEYMRVYDLDGQFIRVSTNIDELEAEFLAKAPEDKKQILSFTSAIRKIRNIKMPIEKSPDLLNILDFFKLMVRFLPYSGLIKKWVKISLADFAKQCKNPLLRKTFHYAFMPEMATIFIIMALGWMSKKSAGYPIGGSLNFARLIEKKYLELGGKIHYNSKVEKILTKDNSACGIQLANGKTFPSDIVISAADGHATIYNMLEGKYTDETISKYYNTYKIFPSYLQVSAGINRTFPDSPQYSLYSLKEPLTIDPQSKRYEVGVKIYNFDPTLAPKGKTVITSLLPTYNYEYWTELREKDKTKYKAEKERIGNAFIDLLEEKLGNIKNNVETIDVSSPATVNRYTGNWKGSLEGWILTPEVGLKPMKKTLPGLSNFYMAGQWVEPGGGIPTALLSGRNITQMICKNDKKKFVS